MSVVRLEMTVPDAEAADVANRLAGEHLGVIGERAHGNMTAPLPDGKQ